jgi:glycosyltransferase involved in cell wall biosynthesis
MAQAKVSCLTATYDRLPLLKESIRCYCAQSYENRELVVATEGTQRYKRAIHRFVDELERDDIRIIELDSRPYSLGEVRNILLDEARGDLVCQWDDDDLYHPERLAVQVDYLEQRKADAVFLTDQLYFFWNAREVYWMDWRVGTRTVEEALIPGTLLMRGDRRFKYPEITGHEDSKFMRDLIDAGLKVEGLSEAGFLYGRIYHGKNYFGLDHHLGNAHYHAQSAEFVQRRRGTLMAALQSYRVPRPLLVGARGGSGQIVYLD